MRVFEASADESYINTWALEEYNKGVYSLGIANDDKLIAVGCGDKTVTLVQTI
jgi:hypothetical protein